MENASRVTVGFLAVMYNWARKLPRSWNGLGSLDLDNPPAEWKWWLLGIAGFPRTAWSVHEC